MTSSVLGPGSRRCDTRGEHTRLRREGRVLRRLQEPVILCRVRTPKFIPSFEVPQLDRENRCLDSVHPAVPAHHGMMVFSDLAVVPEDPNLVLQFRLFVTTAPASPNAPRFFPG